MAAKHDESITKKKQAWLDVAFLGWLAEIVDFAGSWLGPLLFTLYELDEGIEWFMNL